MAETCLMTSPVLTKKIKLVLVNDKLFLYNYYYFYFVTAIIFNLFFNGLILLT